MSDHSVSPEQAARRWFQEPMVWMVIMIPFTAVVVGMIMLGFAIHSNDGLVEDDYYRKGKEINRVLARDDAARRLQISATMTINGTALDLELLHNSEMTAPASLQLKLLHRTRAGLDQVILMRRQPDGSYLGEADHAVDGYWTIQLETSQWRISGNSTLPTTSPVALAAQ